MFWLYLVLCDFLLFIFRKGADDLGCLPPSLFHGLSLIHGILGIIKVGTFRFLLT